MNRASLLPNNKCRTSRLGMTYALQKGNENHNGTLNNTIMRLSVDTTLNYLAITNRKRINNKDKRDIRMANDINYSLLQNVREVDLTSLRGILYTSNGNITTKAIYENSRRNGMLVTLNVKNAYRDGSTNRLSHRVIPITSLVTSLSLSKEIVTNLTTTRRDDDTRDDNEDANSLRRNTTKGLIQRGTYLLGR